MKIEDKIGKYEYDKSLMDYPMDIDLGIPFDITSNEYVQVKLTVYDNFYKKKDNSKALTRHKIQISAQHANDNKWYTKFVCPILNHFKPSEYFAPFPIEASMHLLEHSFYSDVVNFEKSMYNSDVLKKNKYTHYSIPFSAGTFKRPNSVNEFKEGQPITKNLKTIPWTTGYMVKDKDGNGFFGIRFYDYAITVPWMLAKQVTGKKGMNNATHYVNLRNNNGGLE